MSFDKKLLGVPVVGKLSLGNNISQFASTLSILTSSGVPLVDAMQISSEVLSNTMVKNPCYRCDKPRKRRQFIILCA